MASVTIHQHDDTYTRVDALHVTGPNDRYFLLLKLGDDISVRLFGNDADAVAHARTLANALVAAADALEQTLKDATPEHANANAEGHQS